MNRACGFSSNVCSAGDSEGTRFGSAIEGPEEGDPTLATPRMKVSGCVAFCTLGVYVSLRSVPDLVRCQPRKAHKVKVPHESLEMNRVQNHWPRGQSCPGGDQQSPEAMLSSSFPFRRCPPSFPIPNSISLLADRGLFLGLDVGCLCGTERLRRHSQNSSKLPQTPSEAALN